jgi:uncharacterized membrane protein YjjB (DUF3815 family)
LPWAALNCLLGYFGSVLGSALKNDNFGAFASGTFVSIYGLIWSNKVQRPVHIVVVPSLYFLVACSSAIHGFVEILEGETEAGEKEFFQMFVTALDLAAGFVVGNAIVPKMKLSI